MGEKREIWFIVRSTEAILFFSHKFCSVYESHCHTSAQRTSHQTDYTRKCCIKTRQKLHSHSVILCRHLQFENRRKHICLIQNGFTYFRFGLYCLILAVHLFACVQIQSLMRISCTSPANYTAHMRMSV